MSDSWQIKAQNIKCGGCATAIQNGLKALPGVTAIHVDIGSGLVTVECHNLAQTQITAKLAELGYPAVES